MAQDKKIVEEMLQKSGQLGVPVIIVDGEVILGFKQGKLEELLAK